MIILHSSKRQKNGIKPRYYVLCICVCRPFKNILMYIVLGAIELRLMPFLLTFFFLNSTYNSIRKHSSAVFLRQRKLGEMFDFSTLNDLCVIWGTMFNNASHYMIIFRGYFELIQAMNIEVNYS